MGLINVSTFNIDKCNKPRAYFICFCLEFYKPFYFSNRKEEECISLGETASCTNEPRMLYLRTGSTSQHAIVDAEDAWHWLPLIPDWFSTALESPFHTTYLSVMPQH
jgi:hypothetical protein